MNCNELFQLNIFLLRNIKNEGLCSKNYLGQLCVNSNYSSFVFFSEKKKTHGFDTLYENKKQFDYEFFNMEKTD